MKIKLPIVIFLSLNLLSLAACNWNRTEKAQRQIFAPGPDAPSSISGTLQRTQDYFKESESTLLEKMR
tara:strand:+ start:1495 stop:1698 length:204 start_codon:yes stop_codon:yes gene_type:complete